MSGHNVEGTIRFGGTVMSLEVVSRDGYLRKIGYSSEDGNVSDRSIANLLRVPISRWGLCRRRDVLGYVRKQLGAAGVLDSSDGRLKHIMDRISELGDCEVALLDGTRHLVPTDPVMIHTGSQRFAFLGSLCLPQGVPDVGSNDRDIVRRFEISDEDCIAFLESVNVKEMSVAERFSYPGYLLHASRRMDETVASNEMTLDKFWTFLCSRLRNEGLKVDDEASIRILSGARGGFFGRHDNPALQGRWTAADRVGVWCGYRTGHSDRHWNPCIVKVTSDGAYALDLFDEDEWKWAVLSKGRNCGEDEIINIKESTISVTFPAPSQLRSVFDILGFETKPWSWTVGSEVSKLRNVDCVPTFSEHC